MNLKKARSFSSSGFFLSAHHKEKEGGQALVLVIVTLAVVVTSILLMVSSGQLATEKMRLQNTADATAYSAGVMLARDYNFSAYTNRGMVANQVAAAQLTALGSLARHNRRALSTFLNDGFAGWNGGVALLCGVGAIASTPALDLIKLCVTNNSNFKSAKTNDSSANNIISSAMRADGDIIKILSDSGQLYHRETALYMVEFVKKMVAANDTDASLAPWGVLTIGQNVYQSQQFTKQYGVNYNRSVSAGLPRFADVTLSSLDKMSSKRDTNSNWMDELAARRYDPYFTMFGGGTYYTAKSTSIYPYYYGLYQAIPQHAGGSELSANFKGWTSYDGSDWQTVYRKNHTLCVWIIVEICADIPYWYDEYPGPPIAAGHGVVTASQGKSLGVGVAMDMGSRNYRRSGGGVVNSYGTVSMPFVGAPLSLAGNMVNSWVNPSAEGSKFQFPGLLAYNDLSQLGTSKANQWKNVPNISADGSFIANGKTSNVPHITIGVEKSISKIQTIQNMLGGYEINQVDGPAKKLNDRLASNKMSALAAAEPYFARPDQTNFEWPSLFNPYWQARLRATPQSEIFALTYTQAN
jgi:hypothetical protein